jgi:hypothetical protein
MTFGTIRSLAAIAALLATSTAWAHIGVVNLSTPSVAAGQTTFAVAGSTSEIQFVIPHGCTAAESTPAFSGANLDTYKIAITIPAAIVSSTTVASLRPALDGTFGTVAIGAPDPGGNVTLTWVRKAADAPGEANHTAADTQLYKVSVRLRAPNVASATDTAIRKHQFLATQYCKAGATEYAMAWGIANSPTLLVFPDRRTGFNRYTLDASTLPDFTPAGGGTLAARLKGYFGDAAIVWVGKAGYSANAATGARIQTLIGKDPAYSNLGTAAGRSLSATESIWVKY